VVSKNYILLDNIVKQLIISLELKKYTTLSKIRNCDFMLYSMCVIEYSSFDKYLVRK